MGGILDTLTASVASWTPLEALILLPSAADRLPVPWKFITRAPKMCAIFCGSTYILFCIIFMPLYILSYAISSIGAGILFSWALIYATRILARMLSFPGSSSYVQREIEKEYSKFTALRLMRGAATLRTWIKWIGKSNSVPNSLSDLDEFYREIMAIYVEDRGYMNVLRKAIHTLLVNSSNQEDDSELGSSPILAQPLGVADLTVSKTNTREILIRLDEKLATVERLLPIVVSIVSHCKLIESMTLSIFLRGKYALKTNSKIKKCTQAVEMKDINGGSYGSDNFYDSGWEEYINELLEATECISNLSDLFVPPEESSDDPFAILKMWWKSSEPLIVPGNFDLLREEMLVHFKGRQIWLTMADGILIDGCIVAPVSKNDVETGTKEENRCVLFCNPNAAYYESIFLGSGQESRDWITFYTSIGCHVFVYNYRGFGRSQGTPNPAKLQSDACEIVSYLKEIESMDYVAVHGESIGGMVAAHAACTSQVDLAILDRTFCSLPAAAQRLLGSWTNPVMWFATQWSTNVARDYLSIPCPKLIACDPNDSIVADTASLKAGVALLCELDRGTELGPARNQTKCMPVVMPSVGGYITYSPLYPPQIYALSDHTGIQPPIVSPRYNTPLINDKLNLNSIVHFAACVRDIGRRSTVLYKSKLAISKMDHIEMTNVSSEKKLLANLENGINIHRDTSSSDDENYTEKYSKKPKNKKKMHAVASEKSPIQIDKKGKKVTNIQQHDRFENDSDGEFDAKKDVEITEIRNSRKMNVSNASFEPPLLQTWKIICNIDNFCGRRLGNASACGFDDIRTWVCCLLIWGNRSLSGPRTPSSDNIKHAILNLRRLVSEYPIDLASDLSLKYVIDFFNYLFERLNRSTRFTFESEANELESSKNDLGWLISLNCGHNSPFSYEERSMLKKFLEMEGWVIYSQVCIEDSVVE